MNWISSLGSKRTQLALAVIVPAVMQIVQALMAGQPIPLEAVYIVLGAGGFWSVSDSIRPTVKPADAADFARIQKILEDLQIKIKEVDEGKK